MKLIKLDRDYYIVIDNSDNGRAKKGFNWNFSLESIQKFDNDCLENTSEWQFCRKIIASSQPLEGVLKIDLRQIRGITGEIDIEKYYYSLFTGGDSLIYPKGKEHKKNWIEGFKSCQDLNENRALNSIITWLDEINNSIFAFSASKIELDMIEQFKNKVKTFLPKTEWEVEFNDNKELVLTKDISINGKV